LPVGIADVTATTTATITAARLTWTKVALYACNR
jgi:hypothetical protein